MAQAAVQISNNDIREGVLWLIGKIEIEGIPVGGYLGSIIGYFWTAEENPKPLWDSIKVYAEALVKEEIDKARIDGLSTRLAGLGKAARQYTDANPKNYTERSGYLTAFIQLLNAFHDDFWKERSTPERMFPLFTTFGTLEIAAKAELAFHYKDVFGTEDAGHAKHLKDFNDAVKEYSDAAQAMYDRLYAWRFGKLQLIQSKSKDFKTVQMQYDSTWTFTDNYDGYTRSKIGYQMNDWSYYNPEGLALMEREQHDRVSLINGGWLQGLQEALTVSQLWRYLDPAVARPLTHDVIDGEGPWGGDRDKAHDFAHNPPLDSRITKIRLRHGAFIDCLEIFYNGQSAGAHGNSSTGTLSELELAADEYIVQVFGRASSLIDHIGFKTNKGRTIEGGSSPHGSGFSATGRPAWNEIKGNVTSLFAVSGWTDGNRLCGLKLHWKHKSVVLTYGPSYKKSRVLPAWSDVYLKAQDGQMISTAVLEYETNAAAREWFPKMGPTGVKLRIAPDPQTDTAFHDHHRVCVLTMESQLGEFNCLNRFSYDKAYYYQAGNHPSDYWTLLKAIPSDGPVLVGDKIYLRSEKTGEYLAPASDKVGYVSGATGAPYAWEVVLA